MFSAEAITTAVAIHAATLMFSAEAIATAVAVVIHAATLAVTITKTIAAKIYCT